MENAIVTDPTRTDKYIYAYTYVYEINIWDERQNGICHLSDQFTVKLYDVI